MDCEDLKFFIFFASCCLLIAFKIQCTFLSHLSAGIVFSCPLSCFCFSFSLLLFWQILFYLYSLVVILRFSFVFFAPSLHNCIFTFFFLLRFHFLLSHTLSLSCSLSLLPTTTGLQELQQLSPRSCFCCSASAMESCTSLFSNYTCTHKLPWNFKQTELRKPQSNKNVD